MVHGVEELVLVDETAEGEVDEPRQENFPAGPEDGVDEGYGED